MKTLGNILWLALAGVWLALGWLFWAAVSPSRCGFRLLANA